MDADSDGDADVIYFPVTVSYEPTSHNDPDGDGKKGLSDPADPGFTWIYKALIDTTDPDAMTWCQFYDPFEDIGVRPEVYYSVTASWQTDGSLGLYWGTGTPYSRTSTEKGYFFAMKDKSPLSCSTATPLDCGTDGVVTLEAGEGLTGDQLCMPERCISRPTCPTRRTLTAQKVRGESTGWLSTTAVTASIATRTATPQTTQAMSR